MSKFVILLVVASLVACISADDDSFGDFDPFGLGDIASDFPKSSDFIDGVKNLKKPQDGHVSGHAETYEHETKSVNGHPVLDESNSDEVDNIDGDVTEQKSDN